ncbi:MAG TPA: O-antigen ligase family protein [Pirellulaceae bacterium]|nr:O-antigen ligase family protein [Pirellulaceae bacterium]
MRNPQVTQSTAADAQLSSITTREVVVILPLIVGIGALPWLFGGVHTSSQLLLAGCVLVGLLIYIFARPASGAAFPATLLPLLLAIGLGFVQQWPLGDALDTVSPRSNELWEVTLIANGPAAETLAVHTGELVTSRASTISLYPLSTRRDLILLSTAVAVFFLASQLLAHRRWQRLLFAAIAANGAIFAFFGIAQQLVWNGLLYGQVPLTQGGRPFAAFVNSNNAGGYLNLCLAAAIGFTLYAFSRDGDADSSHRSNSRFSSPIDRDSQRSSRWFERLGGRLLAEFAQLNGAKLLAVVMLVLIFAGLLCTLSRGAWLSMALSAVVVAAVLVASRRVAYVAGTLVLVVALGYGLVDWLGRTDVIGARWQTLRAQLADPTDGRLAHWPVGLRAAGDFWLLGSGLGTYRYVYRPYADTDDAWFYHAENQYVEALLEGGVLGLGLLLAAIVTIGFACRRLLLDRSPARRICGVVGIYALVSQAVQALFDFGLYLPANTALFALICGAVAGASGLRRTATGWLAAGREVFADWSRRSEVQAGFASLLFGGLLLGAVDLNKSRAVELALDNSQVADSYATDSVVSVTGQIRHLSAALAKTPGHAAGHLELAKLWIQRYRLQSLVELQATAPAGTSDDQLWSLTMPLMVQGTVYRYASEGRTIELENLRRSEPVQTDLNHAARALVQSVRGCPLLPRAQLLLAEIAPVVAPDASPARWLYSVTFLAGGNAPLLNECAVAQLQAGEVQDALRTLHRMVEISPERLPTALQLAALFVLPEEAVRKICPDSIYLLVEVAGSEYGSKDDRMRQALLDRAEELLSVAALESADRYRIEGTIHALLARQEQAIELLEKAVAGRPDMTAWRYELASLLHQQGDLEGAWEHARTCVRMEPGNEQFDALLQQLNRTRLRQKG